MPKKTANKETKVFVLIASLIAVVLTALFVKNSMTDVDTNNSGTEPTQVVQPVVAPPEVPEGWEQYVNEEYGYSFWHPGTLENSGSSSEGNARYFAIYDLDSGFSITAIDGSLDDAKAIVESAHERNEKITSDVVEISGRKTFVLSSKFLSQGNQENKLISMLIEDGERTFIIAISGNDRVLSNPNTIQDIVSTFRIIE